MPRTVNVWETGRRCRQPPRNASRIFTFNRLWHAHDRSRRGREPDDRVFFAFQRYFIEGIRVAGVKG
jgi:hypothetical protein